VQYEISGHNSSKEYTMDVLIVKTVSDEWGVLNDWDDNDVSGSSGIKEFNFEFNREGDVDIKYPYEIFCEMYEEDLVIGESETLIYF